MFNKSVVIKGLTALFLCLSSQVTANSAAIEQLVEAEVYNSVTWHNLLHYDGQINLVADGFLLSAEYFSPKQELIASFNHLAEAKDCRFIARKLFINQELKKRGIRFQLPDVNCTDYTSYRAKVPAQELDLIFASEILDSPTSMLGHIFIKASGTNDKGVHVAHTLSFFNEIDTPNPVVLLNDALISGMPGYFIVHPFSESVNRYVIEEKRNLYTYELDTEQYRKDLLMAHLWELKQIKINYLFQSYNCATMALFLLGILQDDVTSEKGLWVTPLDVVKAAEKKGLITDYSGLFTPEYIAKVKQNSTEQLSAVTYKPPQGKPADSNISAKYIKAENSEYLTLAMAPVAKVLIHDSSAFLDESSLVMGELELGLELDSQKLLLSKFTLYEMNQFIGQEHLHFATGFLSSHHLTATNRDHWYLNAAKGFSKTYGEQSLFYTDLVANLNITAHKPSIELGAKFGLLHSVSSFKLSSEFTLLQSSATKLNRITELEAAYQINKEIYIELSGKKVDNRDYKEYAFGLGLSKLF